jgi:DNA-binding GntR family transcriptional regulator
MAAITDRPLPYDMDADRAPQYIKLARLLRHKIRSGAYMYGEYLPGMRLAREYEVSAGIAYKALAVLAASKYVSRSGDLAPYFVDWLPVTQSRSKKIPG